MLYHSKFYSIGKILQKKFSLKKFATEVKNEVEDFGAVPSLLHKISQNLLVPSLGQDKLKKINEITGLTAKMGHLSWAKISVPLLKIEDWNFQSMPENFRSMDEASVLRLACKLKQNLPYSDLYVMEKIGSREGSKSLNEIRLSSMLMVLLNDCSNNVQDDEKVVFQKENILNVLYNLSFGNERISARHVFERMIYEAHECEKSDVPKNNCAIFHSLTRTNLENLKFYDSSSVAQQESLSFVLLLTLSFIDVFIHHNVESLKKIQTVTRLRKTQK